MSEEKIFECERLYARSFRPVDDAPAAFALYGDAEVTRYLNLGVVDANVEATRLRLERYRSIENGSGIMALLSHDDELVGTILLKHLPDGSGNATGEWEVGWHLGRNCWGRGYATEAGAAALKYGFEKRNLTEIFAVVDSENNASRKVVERLGMVHLGRTDRYYGETLELYRATR